MTKKEILKEILKEQEISDFGDMFEHIDRIACDEKFENNFIISFDSVSEQCDSYIFATYYSNVLHKSIIMDWDFNSSFEDEDEFIDCVLKIEEQAQELKAKHNI